MEPRQTPEEKRLLVLVLQGRMKLMAAKLKANARRIQLFLHGAR